MLELIMLIYRETDTRRFQRTLEDTTPKQEVRRHPHLWISRPLGPPVSLRVVMSVPPHLLGCIYAVL